MKIRIGVQDIPYGYGDDPDKTTFEVATDLENDYQLFSIFFKLHEKEIIEEAKELITLQIQNNIRYNAPLADIFILGKTVALFHAYLEREQMAGLTDKNVPTKAALDGVNSRLKIRRGARRPSFIDGGLLKATFIAWIEEDENR